MKLSHSYVVNVLLHNGIIKKCSLLVRANHGCMLLVSKGVKSHHLSLDSECPLYYAHFLICGRAWYAMSREKLR